ncbi:MAG TPA: Stp1/IreP family PP2C-type Ser/Thr phosphatase [Solirubrobacteraceae bacterium]|nr:Stp1/IreP family PP2C-type Ser/Thr phosphatase [Solirubrobacteraceae bacterium]
MLTVAEQFAATDTGRQRRANEDSLFVRAPLYVVADGMGGAQAGEVASGVAVAQFRDAPAASVAAEPEAALVRTAQAANTRIHELSHANPDQAGMGTTLTAAYVGPSDVVVVHVGDSRAYRLRDGELLRLTDDHSLVDELMREGRLTPEEAVDHPQRSVITRALGPYEEVEVDTRNFQGRDGDLVLLCSDGLTSMVSEERIAEILAEGGALERIGRALIAEANRAGGRDNITVLLLRLRDVDGGVAGNGAQGDADATSEMAVASPPPRGRLTPRTAEIPAAQAAVPRPRRNVTRARNLLIAGSLIALLVVVGLYEAIQSIYFVGTNGRGLVTIYQGLPYKLPAGVPLYSTVYVSGVPASAVPAHARTQVLDLHGRSEQDAREVVRGLELGHFE